MRLPSKVYPQVASVDSGPVASPAPASSGGGGCSAFASSESFKTKTPWDLIFGFLLEVLLTLVVMRLVFRFSRA